MFLFEFNDLDAAIRFYQVCAELGLNTEEERQEILINFVEYGEIKRVQFTERTKDQYVEDMSREFNVLDLTGELNEKETEN